MSTMWVRTERDRQVVKPSAKKSDWFWDWTAKRYDKRAQDEESLIAAVDRSFEYLEAGDRVLDYACGTGAATFQIAASVHEVHGIDASAAMIELAQQRARDSEVSNVHFSQKTIFDEELAKESFDVILAFNILHLLEDARLAIRRASELLKPEGLVVSVTPCLGEAGVVPRTLLPLISKLGILSYLKSFRISDAKDLFRDAGYQTLESESLEGGIPSCLVIARKQ